MTFEDLQLAPELLAAVAALGFTRPTPVQEQAIPPALQGRDILAKAQTGTGKTAAFGLPLLQRLMPESSVRPRLLVITPTRELAAQVDQHLAALAARTPLKGLCIVGGEDMRRQEDRLRRGCDWIVATPGRLLDHLRQDYMDMGALQALVLDEADRLLELGFVPEIQELVSYLPPRRQTLLLSATLPTEMQSLARQLLDKPVRIDIGAAAPPDPVGEEVWPVAARQKFDLLAELIGRRQIKGALLFCRTRQRAESLGAKLAKAGFKSGVLHADRPMPERRQALAAFRSGECEFLAATDLAARGLDIEDIGWVVNYDVPGTAEDYVHRAGRTGRAGKGGTVITLMAPNEEINVAKAERLTGRPLRSSRLEDFAYITERQSGPAPRTHSRQAMPLNTRPASPGKKESPFTRTGKVRPGYEIPDPEKERQKPVRKRTRLRKRLPHEK